MGERPYGRTKGAVTSTISWPELIMCTQVIELSPSSFLGYQLKHACMHGAQRYDEAIMALDIMVSKLDHVSDTHSRGEFKYALTSMR